MMKAVIFDMDGVIVDTEPGYFYALNEYLARFGVSVSREFNEQLIGISYSRIWQLVVREYGLRGIPMEEFLQGMETSRKARIAREGYRPVPGTIRLMGELQEAGILMAIASSSPAAEIEEVMDSIGIRRYIRTFVSAGDECERGKPDPEVFLKAAERLGVSHGDCLVIEDGQPGITGAKTAGMYALGYRDPFGNQRLEGADFVAASMEDVDLDLCRRIAD